MPRASAKRKASGVPPSGAESSKAAKRRKTRADVSDDASGDEDADVAPVRHASALHVLGTTRRDTLRDALLAWYATVQDAREMPWRRPWDETLSSAERAQRAYEVRPRAPSRVADSDARRSAPGLGLGSYAPADAGRDRDSVLHAMDETVSHQRLCESYVYIDVLSRQTKVPDCPNARGS